jgi:hypothetical protein
LLDTLLLVLLLFKLLLKLPGVASAAGTIKNSAFRAALPEQ